MVRSAINGVAVLFQSALYRYAGVRYPGNVFGWRDLRGHFIVPASGGSAGTREQFKTGVYELGYNASDVLDWGFHLVHDLVQGGDKFLHVHVKLGAGATASVTNLVINAEIGYYRHNRTGSPVPISKTFTITPAELNAAQNGTLIVEVLIAQSGGGSGLLDSLVDWVPDDDLGVSLTISTIPTIAGASPANVKIGIPHVDIHEQALWATTPRRVMVNNSFWN